MGGRLVIVGHGLIARQAYGPVVFGQAPESLVVRVRRYRCRACRAIVVVGPQGLAPGRSYSGPAIAGALAAFAAGATSAAVRARTSPAKTVGTSATERWATLVRWVEAARTGRLFAVAGLAELSRRRVAEQVTLALAARAGHERGDDLGASAFAGAALAA
jgi:hypothetical protein